MAGAVTHLFLFDIDSVLVEALGYLKALQDTVAHFSRQMGAGDHPLTEVEARTFEAHGLTSEWDSGAACVGLLLVERLRQEPDLSVSPSWSETVSFLGAHSRPLPRPDYGALAIRAGARLDDGTTPAQAARSLLQDLVEGSAGLARHRVPISALLDVLLGRTHDFYSAPVTRYLQHLAIGSDLIPQTYGVTPDLESPPYLLRYDRPLLTPASRFRLVKSVSSGRVGATLYTARPSLPPAETDGPTVGFSPEAEAAQTLVDLAGLPLIGAGKMRWLAAEENEDVERLVKPSPVQGLAAIGAARSGQEEISLRAALSLQRDGRLVRPLVGLGASAVHVFEDTLGGLAAVERAVAKLRAAGQPVAYYPYGIVGSGRKASDGPKAVAMAERGVPTYPSINEAVAMALDRVC